MTQLRAWFDSRSLRERRLLLVMMALAVLTILWAGIIRPVGDGLSSARELLAGAVMRVGETEARIDALRDIQSRRPPPLTGSLADNIRARAANAGFALASIDEDGPGRVRIGIQSAKPAALTAWIARLENAGILVDSLTLTDNGDRTVGVTGTFKARGV